MINTVLEKFNSTLLVCGKPVIFDGAMWLISLDYNMLLKYDEAGTVLLNKYMIPGKMVSWGHFNVVAHAGKLILFPLYGYGIYVFNLSNETFQELNYDRCLKDGKKERYDIVENVGDNLIFIDSYSNHVFEYSWVSGSIRRIDMKLLECLRNHGVDIASSIFTTEYCRVKDTLYIPIANSNKFIIFDLKSSDAVLHSLETKASIWSVAGNEDRVVFTTIEREIVVWKNESVLEIKDKDYITEKENTLLKPVCLCNKNYYFSWKGRELYLDDNGTIIKTELPFLSTDTRYPVDVYYQFQWIFVERQQIYVQSRINGDIFVIDAESNEVCVLRLPFPKDEVSRLINDFNLNLESILLREDDVFSLESLIKSLL